MSSAAIVEQAPGLLALSGVLDYQSGPALREQGGRLIRATLASTCVVDCSAVEKSSSVGLSLLLSYTRDAQAAGKALSIRSLPQDMSGIAKVCELHHVLPLEA